MKKNLLIFFLFLIITLFLILNASAQDIDNKPTDPLQALKDEVLSYILPLKGKVVSVEGQFAKVQFEVKEKMIKKGIRLRVFQLGSDYFHPITKENIGKIEIPVGIIEIESYLGEGLAIGRIIEGKFDNFKDLLVRVPDLKTKVLFYQNNIDWFLADEYYQALKQSNKIEFVDSKIDTDDIKKVLEEAKKEKVSIALVLSSHKKDSDIVVTQRLFWADDSQAFSERSVSVSKDYANKIRLRSGFIALKNVEMLFSYDLPFSANRLIVGDFDGDKNLDIVLVSSNIIRFYTSKVDLNLLWQLNLPRNVDIVWVDTVDFKSSGKDLILITAKDDNDYVSYIYELQGNKFIQLSRFENIFIKSYGDKILGQNYSPTEGFGGMVFNIDYKGKSFEKGKVFKLPLNLNLYDFQHVYAPDGKEGIFFWDENGFLRLMDINGSILWSSKEDLGGFSTSFVKESLSGLFEKGKWSIKDRLIYKDGEVFAPKRVPIFGKARGLGFKESAIKAFWWNGITVEEKNFVDDIGGEIIDYTITEDRVFILASPLLGIKLKNILKGESPLGVMLYVYSTKSR
ncbi:MAG: VCBS repeat-containing protein [Thermodesulfovibrionales bacterium]|nr:VCBS repeat-containing protein [Thermodesulfovibrionales bacterium]